MTDLAILAGQGALPRMIAAQHPGALFVTFAGVPVAAPANPTLQASFERFGQLFADLKSRGIARVVFAGGLSRPALDPARFDAKMQALFPGFMTAMAGGDDGLLRAVIAAFEAEGFAVAGAHDLVPGLIAPPGLLAGPAPGAQDLADAARARAILTALGPHDVGQGAVVAGGQCLGIETAQGTDAMLAFVAQHPDTQRHGARGVLLKAPKPGQDLRIDMPAIGPDTVTGARAAGLAGIAIEAGHVLLLDRPSLLDTAEEAGLFVLAQNP